MWRRKAEAERQNLGETISRQQDQIADLTTDLRASNAEVARLGKRGRVEEDEEGGQRGVRKQRRLRAERSRIFQALEELERDIENVGQGLDGFGRSRESVLDRMKRAY